ncbi:DivIVA domain-containing protein [Thermovirga sp.]|uniref:DivIVA domain-containing protein n=1 Tax=Thermovirga sp. TaxID=2699834 RepID=UPI0025D22E82|nr:DivIVA domain-containing protein [Thermovirga sp.]MBO8153405.1 DivIVA domain-containing protein [Thermovirga sp.]MCD6189851.1 DivIVA domain-containing protein [Thermococcus sp.]
METIMTVLDIENISFSRSLRGYNPEEVEDFIEKVIVTVQDYSEKIKILETTVARMEDQLKEYNELKKSLQDALVLAQKSAEERVNNAESKAEVIIAEAEAEAHKIVMDAKEKAEAYRRDIERLKQVRYQFIAEFKGLISKYGSLLNSLETTNIDREEIPVKEE